MAVQFHKIMPVRLYSDLLTYQFQVILSRPVQEIVIFFRIQV